MWRRLKLRNSGCILFETVLNKDNHISESFQGLESNPVQENKGKWHRKWLKPKTPCSLPLLPPSFNTLLSVPISASLPWWLPFLCFYVSSRCSVLSPDFSFKASTHASHISLLSSGPSSMAETFHSRSQKLLLRISQSWTPDLPVDVQGVTLRGWQLKWDQEEASSKVPVLSASLLFPSARIAMEKFPQYFTWSHFKEHYNAKRFHLEDSPSAISDLYKSSSMLLSQHKIITVCIRSIISLGPPKQEAWKKRGYIV